MSIKSNYFSSIVKPKYSAKFSSTPPNSQILFQILKYSAISPNFDVIIILETNSTKYPSLFSWTYYKVHQTLRSIWVFWGVLKIFEDYLIIWQSTWNLGVVLRITYILIIPWAAKSVKALTRVEKNTFRIIFTEKTYEESTQILQIQHLTERKKILAKECAKSMSQNNEYKYLFKKKQGPATKSNLLKVRVLWGVWSTSKLRLLYSGQTPLSTPTFSVGLNTKTLLSPT